MRNGTCLSKNWVSKESSNGRGQKEVHIPLDALKQGGQNSSGSRGRVVENCEQQSSHQQPVRMKVKVLYAVQRLSRLSSLGL